MTVNRAEAAQAVSTEALVEYLSATAWAAMDLALAEVAAGG
jgi:hypothetical protein